MTTRFIHTADWQLGKPFARVEDAQKRSLLQMERINVIHRIAQAAQGHQAQFVLVAGDLFDSPSPSKSTVSAACSAIGKLNLPVLVIPGNHDHGGPGSVWEQEFFKREQASLAPNLRILLTPEPVELETAVLFPCPLLRRAESQDLTGWLRSFAEWAGFSDKPRIVLAHGSTQSFGSASDDEEGSSGSNQIDLSRLSETEFDYIALGDWHGTKQISPKAWYSGTPENDRFQKGEGNYPGNILAVQAARSALPEVQTVAMARFRWHETARVFSDDQELDLFETELRRLLENRANEDLLAVQLSGSLSVGASYKLENLIESLQARLLRLKLVDKTVIAPAAAEISSLCERQCDPLIANVARQLVAQAMGQEESNAVARTALRELHRACIQP